MKALENIPEEEIKVVDKEPSHNDEKPKVEEVEE